MELFDKNNNNMDEIDIKEMIFKEKLARYKKFKTMDENERYRIKTEVLLEWPKLQEFNDFCKKEPHEVELVDNKIYTYTPTDINYYLQKNFIVNRYAKHNRYIQIQNNESLLNHYRFLLNENFDDINLSMSIKTNTKRMIVQLYLNNLTIPQNEILANLKNENPNKFLEVFNLLSNYKNYYKEQLMKNDEEKEIQPPEESQKQPEDKKVKAKTRRWILN